MAEAAAVEAPGANGTAAPPGGAPDTSWQAQIPTEYANDKSFEPFKTKGLGDLLKSHAEAQKVISSSIRLPQKDAAGKVTNLEEWKRANLPKLAEIGIGVPAAPATPADYQFERPEQAQQLGWDEEAEGHMRSVFHKAGMTNEQVSAVIAGYAGWQGVRLGKAETYMQETEAALKTEWGADYDAKMGATTRFVAATGAKFGIPQLMTVTGLGNNPSMVRWIASIAPKGEHQTMANGTDPGSGADVGGQLAQIRTEMQKTNMGSPRMAELQASLEALLQQQHGNQ